MDWTAFLEDISDRVLRLTPEQREVFLARLADENISKNEAQTAEKLILGVRTLKKRMNAVYSIAGKTYPKVAEVKGRGKLKALRACLKADWQQVTAQSTALSLSNPTTISASSNQPESANAAEIDFQPYLQSILNDETYQDLQDCYTPTTVEDRKQPSQPKLSRRLKLRAETVQAEKTQKDPDARGQLEQVEQWDVLAGLRQYATEHVLLIGKPGSGKSTSLEQLLWEEANSALQNPAVPIPVLVKLRRCTSTIENLIQDFFTQHQLPLATADIQCLLQQGKLLLLLDGLNELPADFWTEASNFRDRNRKTTPTIVSTRDLSIGGTLGIKKTLKMLPLTEPQMQELVQGYLDEQDGDRLFQQLKGDRLRKFAETPLLLWMLCRVFAQKGTVPANLGLAFREFTQTFDDEIQADAPVQAKGQWPKLLRHLAFNLHSNDPIDLHLSMPREEAETLLTDYLQQEGRTNARDCAERWLQDLLDFHLIQLVIQPNLAEHIEFRHQLIQEYYAAEYLWRLLPKLTDEELKRYYLNYLNWTEPIALMLMLMDEHQKKQALQVIEQAFDVDLSLGGRMAGEVRSSWQQATVDLILRRNVTPTLKIWLLEKTRSPVAIPFLLDTLQNGCSNIRWRAARALRNYSDKLVLKNLVNALKSTDSYVRSNAAKALEKSSDTEVVKHLCDVMFNDEDCLIRSELVDIIGNLGSLKSIECLKFGLKHHDSSVRGKAAQHLGKLIPEELISLLNEEFISGDINTRRDIVNLLGGTRVPEAIPTLIKALSDNNWIVRSNAVDQIGLLGIWLDKRLLKDAVIELVNILQGDPNNSVRSAAALSLELIGDSQIVQILLNSLSQDNCQVVRHTVAHSLGRIQDKAAIQPLICSLQDIDYVREQVIRSLRVLHAIEALPKIRKLVHSENDKIKFESIRFLGTVGNNKDISTLYKFLRKGEDFSIRLCAAYSLSKLNNRKGVPILENAVETGSKEARKLAIDGLKNFGGEVGLSKIILRAFKDNEFSIQEKAVNFLKCFRGNKEVTKKLAAALSSPDEDICRNAMYTAKILGDSRNLSQLRQLAEKIVVVERPLEVASAIQNQCGFYNYEIWQGVLKSQPMEPNSQSNNLSHTKLLVKIDRRIQKMANEPKNDFRGATFQAPVNFGDRPTGDFIGTQNNYAADPEVQSAISDLRMLLTQLQTKYPQINTETEALAIIDAEFTEIQPQFATFRKQLLNPERHLQALKAAAAEVAKHYLEDSILAKAFITYLEKLSEDPAQGA